jgi:hypothetical protein
MSDRIFKVSIHFDAVYGQLEYDTIEKTSRVVLDDAGKKQAVEKYLSESHVIEDADGTDLRTFHAKKLIPTDSLESFKLALTRLWHHTGVYVDWSRPT